MTLRSTRDLLRHELTRLHAAEGRILADLPALIEMVSDEPLRTSLQEHSVITRDHRRRLETAPKDLRADPENGPDGAVAAILGEATALAREAEAGAVRDAAIIAGIQNVEHYQIARYGTALAYARLLGEEDLEDTLERTLTEEREADRRLTGIAESFINGAAASGTGETR